MKMKMIVVFVDADMVSEVERLFEECDVPGYSEIPNVLGKGATGRKLGTRAFPGSSTLYLAVIDETCEEPLKMRLQDLRDGHDPIQGIKVYSLNTEELI